LFLGLSTSINVDVHDLNGASLSQRPVWAAGMQTDVYAGQDDGVETEMKRILEENLGRPPKAVSTATGAPTARASTAAAPAHPTAVAAPTQPTAKAIP